MDIKETEELTTNGRIRRVRKLKAPLPLKQMRELYGIKAAPQGLIYVPDGLRESVPWNEQHIVLDNDVSNHNVQEGRKRKAENSADEDQHNVPKKGRRRKVGTSGLQRGQA